MVTEICEQHLATEIFLLAFYSILEVSQCIICIASLYRVTQTKSLSIKSVIAQWTFFLTSLGFAISRLSASLSECFAMHLFGVSLVSLFFCYACHICSLLLLLYVRLIDIFSNTHFALSRCLKSYFICMLILVACVPLIAWMAFQLSVAVGWLFTGLSLIFVLIVAQHLAWSFVFKLRKMTLAVEANNRNSEILYLIRKNCVLNIECVMFTTSFAFISIISAIIGYGWGWAQILSVIAALDVFVDSLCMFFSFSANDTYYQRLCRICHYHCLSKQTNLVMLQATSMSAAQPTATGSQPTVTVASASKSASKSKD